MFSLTDIRRLLDAFERSDWDDLHFVADGYEVHVSASEGAAAAIAPAPPPPVAIAAAALGDGGVASSPVVATAAAPAAPVAPVTPAALAAPAGPAPSAPAPSAGSDREATEGAHAVVSPSPGIFWRAPAPGEPPFVEVGQPVSADTPIGIVEVMKLMNQVLAGVEGTVCAVLVENGARLELGQPMVLIDQA